jgi:epoxyqueuosine reductase
MNIEIEPVPLVSDFIKDEAGQVGFDKCAILSVTDLTTSNYCANYIKCINEDYHASMSYLERSKYSRFNVNSLIKDAKIVICLAVSYADYEPIPRTNNSVWIARYATRADYHISLYKMLNQLLTRIKERFPEVKGACCVDNKPIAEKPFAEQAGLGFIGKNTLLITPEFGSSVLLGEIILDNSIYEMEDELNKNEFTTVGKTINKDLNIVPDSSRFGCGSCVKCIEACPTKAIVEPYVLDARKCISYLNKDAKLPLDSDLDNEQQNWIFGCDICQEVCPWNNKASGKHRNSLPQIVDPNKLRIDYLVKAMCDNSHGNSNALSERFETLFGGTPVAEMGVRRFIGNLTRVVSIYNELEQDL